MKKCVFIFVLTVSLGLSAFAQTDTVSTTEIVPAKFKSDGCSLFPDGAYRDCCVEHDLAYFNGGSWKMRWRADKKLFKCVAAKKGFEHKILAPLMWTGVRIGGVHFLPAPFRWGFGIKKKPNQK